MTDREKQIEEMARLICDFRYNVEEFSTCDKCEEAKQDKFFKDKFICPMMKKAQQLYNAGYRKMDEITLKLDLGDRSAEEILQIAEAFANEPTTAILVPSNESEIRKQVAKDILQTLHYEIDREKGARTICGDLNYGLDTALNKVENIAEDYGVEIDK